MPSRNEASAISAWWNAVKRFAELFDREIPAGRSPKAVFEELADDLKLEVQALKSQIDEMRPLVARYENGTLFQENVGLRRRNDALRHRVATLTEGNDALVLEVEGLQKKVDRLEKRLLQASIASQPLGPVR
jgi:hypothetical protein